MYQVEIEKYNGPYDVLLQLIEAKDLDITEVALAEITEQYLSYIDTINQEQINSEELASFLVVASKLLYLKSKALLPKVEVDEDEESLEEHLKMYKTFVDASIKIEELIQNDSILFAREKSVVEIEKKFRPPQDVTVEKMQKVFRHVLRLVKPIINLPRAILEKTISLQERVGQMRKLLKMQKNLTFGNVVQESSSKLDIIVSFLAILELANQRHIDFHQENHFDDIILKKLIE